MQSQHFIERYLWPDKDNIESLVQNYCNLLYKEGSYNSSAPACPRYQVLCNLCRATSGGYINFGCSREVFFFRGLFQWSMSLHRGDNFAGQER